MIERIEPDKAITLDAYRQLNLTRPITDGPVGSMTSQKRTHQAHLSELVTERDPWHIASRRNPDDGHLEPVRARGKGSSYPRTRKPINHGTHAGYQMHKARQEDACEDCKVAMRRVSRLRRARINAEAAVVTPKASCGQMWPTT